MRLRGALVAGACVAGLAVAIGACLGATQIVLDVRTNAPCNSPASWQGIAISVGQPGVDVESRAPVLTTTACGAGGEVGTLVIVPTGADNAEVGIRVVAGITANPEDCAANGYVGCIVSRRTLTYLPHQSEDVVVDLTTDCIGNACDVNHTCVNGSCTDTVTATPPVAPDGGVYDPGPTVRCGDDGLRCPANDTTTACCVAFDYDAGTGKGACIAPSACPSTSAIFYCDDSTDCPVGDAGNPIVCAETYSLPTFYTTSAICQPRDSNVQGELQTLCQDRQSCPVTQGTCSADTSAPGYFHCPS